MTNHDTPMLPRQRTDYSAIVDRPPLRLPGMRASSCGRSSNSGRFGDSAVPDGRARCCRPRTGAFAVAGRAATGGWHEIWYAVGRCGASFDLFRGGGGIKADARHKTRAVCL